MLSRRSFIAAASAAFVVDPERQLWVRGAKTWSIPAPEPFPLCAGFERFCERIAPLDPVMKRIFPAVGCEVLEEMLRKVGWKLQERIDYVGADLTFPGLVVQTCDPPFYKVKRLVAHLNMPNGKRVRYEA